VFHIGRRLRRIGRFVAGAHKPMVLEKPWEEKVTEAGRPRSTLDVRGKRLGLWANFSANEICENAISPFTESKKRRCDVD